MKLAELQDHILVALHHGDSLSEVKEEIIEPAPLDEERKAALWIYAATVASPPRRRRARRLSGLPYSGAR
jgi:hypothetical protein